MSADAKPKAGLEDVVAGESAICFLDGDRGVLAYQGYDIHDLANAERGVSFEECCYPAVARPAAGPRRARRPADAARGGAAAAGARDAGDALAADGRRHGRAPDAHVDPARHYDPDAQDRSPQASYRKAVRLTGQLGSIVATWGRMAAGGGPIDPDPALGHAANFLYMLTGQRPSALAARAFDVSLVLHADHELNASTFAARVAAATLTDIHSAIVAAIGTLKGPLHGGANADVMKMLLDIGQDAGAERAEAYVRAKLGAEGKDLGLRPPRLPHGRSARDAPAPVLEAARREGRGSRSGTRCRSASRRS